MIGFSLRKATETYLPVLGKIVSSRYYLILKIQDTILSCILKIVLRSIFTLYLEDTFNKYLDVNKILSEDTFLKILLALANLHH